MTDQLLPTPAVTHLRIIQAVSEEIERLERPLHPQDEAEYIEMVAGLLTMFGTSMQARILRKSAELQYDPEVKARMAREAEAQSSQFYYDEDQWRTP